MFKLLPLLLACIVCSVASPEPDGLYNIYSSSSSIVKPYQTVSLTAKSPSPDQLQSNAVTSGEEEEYEDSNSFEAAGIANEQDSGAPASVTAIVTAAPQAAAAPAPIARLTAVAAAGSSVASASISRSALRVSSSIKLPPSGGSSTTTIQHHILPAETIPLPITISTRPGLRTVIAPETITIHEPTVARVGEVVQKIPTAVSHQSQTVVHKHVRLVTPIVAPAVRTITSQVLRAYHTPLIFAPQTTVVRGGTTNTNVNAKASANANANAKASASASASASV